MEVSGGGAMLEEKLVLVLLELVQQNIRGVCCEGHGG